MNGQMSKTQLESKTVRNLIYAAIVAVVNLLRGFGVLPEGVEALVSGEKLDIIANFATTAASLFFLEQARRGRINATLPIRTRKGGPGEGYRLPGAASGLLFALLLNGCAGMHHGTLVVYDADRVVVRDAVLANRSNEAIAAMVELGRQAGAGSEDGTTGGVMMANGVVLVSPGEVEIERVIGWNWGVVGIDVPGAMERFGPSKQE